MGAGIEKLREVEGCVGRVGPVGRQVMGGERGRGEDGVGLEGRALVPLPSCPKVKAEKSPPLAFDSKSTWVLRSDLLLSNVAWGLILELAQGGGKK